jgi:hypothetical protein
VELCVRLVYALGVDIPGSGATKPVHDQQYIARVSELWALFNVACGKAHDVQVV